MPDETQEVHGGNPGGGKRVRQRFIPCRGYRVHFTEEHSIWLNTEAGESAAR